MCVCFAVIVYIHLCRYIFFLDTDMENGSAWMCRRHIFPVQHSRTQKGVINIIIVAYIAEFYYISIVFLY